MSKQVEWTAEVAAWRASGLTARKFCEGRAFTAARLYWWSSQMARSQDSASRTTTLPMARVVRSRAVSACGPIVIRVGKARVEVSGEVDRAALLVVLQTLTHASLGDAP
jgi:hypothetical protein